MQMLDFNSIVQPTWPVKLKDEEQTVVNLAAPTVQMLEKLQATAQELKKVAKEKNGKTIRAVYALIAEIMSCNDDGFTFTAEELRDKYKMTFVDLVKFVSGYFDFIQEIKDAKN